MNVKEAIDNVESCVHFAMSDYNTRPEEDAYDEESLAIAIKAMKKQEPMKLNREWAALDLACAGCGNFIGGWEERPNYCPDCGQKLDWED